MPLRQCADVVREQGALAATAAAAGCRHTSGWAAMCTGAQFPALLSVYMMTGCYWPGMRAWPLAAVGLAARRGVAGVLRVLYIVAVAAWCLRSCLARLSEAGTAAARVDVMLRGASCAQSVIYSSGWLVRRSQQ